MVKILVYTGVRVSEFIKIKISDVDFEACQIRITQGKGKKDRIVPFSSKFKEVLAVHVEAMTKKGPVLGFQRFEATCVKLTLNWELINNAFVCGLSISDG